MKKHFRHLSYVNGDLTEAIYRIKRCTGTLCAKYKLLERRMNLRATYELLTNNTKSRRSARAMRSCGLGWGSNLLGSGLLVGLLGGSFLGVLLGGGLLDVLGGSLLDGLLGGSFLGVSNFG